MDGICRSDVVERRGRSEAILSTARRYDRRCLPVKGGRLSSRECYGGRRASGPRGHRCTLECFARNQDAESSGRSLSNRLLSQYETPKLAIAEQCSRLESHWKSFGADRRTRRSSHRLCRGDRRRVFAGMEVFGWNRSPSGCFPEKAWAGPGAPAAMDLPRDGKICGHPKGFAQPNGIAIGTGATMADP